MGYLVLDFFISQQKELSLHIYVLNLVEYNLAI